MLPRFLYIDYHAHSNFSDGEGSFEDIIRKAKEQELDCIAITDHFDPADLERKYCLHSDKELINHFGRIREYADKAGQKVLCGIETCTDFEGRLSISDRIFDSCDIIITSPHYIEFDGTLRGGEYYNDRYWESYKEKLLNMALAPGHILGHPESYLPFEEMLVPGTTTFEGRIQLAKQIASRYFDDAFLDQLSVNLNKSGKAYEIHCITESPRPEAMERLLKNNVKFSIGSDGHALKHVAEIGFAARLIEKYDCGNRIYIHSGKQ